MTLGTFAKKKKSRSKTKVASAFLLRVAMRVVMQVVVNQKRDQKSAIDLWKRSPVLPFSRLLRACVWYI